MKLQKYTPKTTHITTIHHSKNSLKGFNPLTTYSYILFKRFPIYNKILKPSHFKEFKKFIKSKNYSVISRKALKDFIESYPNIAKHYFKIYKNKIYIKSSYHKTIVDYYNNIKTVKATQYSFYILQYTHNIYKIGITKDFNTRYRHLSNVYYGDIKVILVEPLKNAYQVEQQLLKEYQDYNIKNEFLQLPARKIKELVNKIQLLK